jgi:hypothetical protein
MLHARIFSLRSLVVLAGALVFAAVSYGFSASNSLPGSRAGDGAAAIAGYALDTTTAPNTTTSLHLSLETDGDPTKILKVRFTINVSGGAAPPQTVSAVFLTSGGSQIGGWYSACTNISGTTWTCSPSGAPAYVQSGIQLRVVAAQ